MGDLEDAGSEGEGVASKLRDVVAPVRSVKLDSDLSAQQEPSEVLLEHSDFQVRLASSRGRRSKSSVLVNRMYSWRGYKGSSEAAEPFNPNLITLQACRDDAVFGTLSLRLDSAAGLAADGLYKDELDAYRAAGAKICEITRLAIDFEHGSKDVFGSLFHLAYIYGGLLRGATDVFIEVNPRHVVFYRRMLNFRESGPCRICERVNAPAVLLHLEASYMAEQIALHGGHRGNSKRSLYPYFFPRLEQDGLARRLAALSPWDVGAFG